MSHSEKQAAPAHRLLVLDDDQAIGRTIGWIAESTGFSVRICTRPQAFFEAVDRWQPTHIAIDLVMPDMDGMEAMRLLAERRCTAHIIITSGVGGRVLDSARRTAIAQGLRRVDALAKPFLPADLRRLLNSTPAAAAVVTATPDAVPDDATPVPADLAIDAESMRLALARRQFVLAYQPKVACATRRLVGFEALVRWAPAADVRVTPDRFIPVMESAGLIDGLTGQIFEQGLRWLSDHAGNTALGLSLNISARSLESEYLAESIAARCRQTGIDPGRLTLELTESSAMDDAVKAMELLTRLRMQGFQLSIDDFGTGFSSMVQLVRLPFSELKIDKSFVMNTAESSEARTVVKSVIDLGHSLGLHLVAEGVESEASFEFIRQLGCDYAQGYFIARPLSGEDAADWVARTGA